MDNKAFSLLEVLLAIALLMIIASFALPVSISQVSSEKVQKELLNVKGQIETYEQYATARKFNKAYGVSFSQSKFSLFDATDCTTPTRNIIDINLENNVKINNISLGGPTEICFLPGEFKPNASGSLDFYDASSRYRLTINSEGAISYIAL